MRTMLFMAWWRQVRCPVRPVEQEWIEQSMDWFVAEFGPDRLAGPVVLPTDEFFPGAYRGTRRDVRAVLERLCAHMGVDPARIDLEFDEADEPGDLAAHVPLEWRSTGAAGHHRLRAGRSVIGVRDDQAARPMALVATIAHELGHVLLLADGRISASRADHEPLTDLLTVYFGLGVFGANSVLDFTPTEGGHVTTRLGYLTEPMFGYALARYAWLRGETDPAWAYHLDSNPRAALKRGLAYLARAR